MGRLRAFLFQCCEQVTDPCARVGAIIDWIFPAYFLSFFFIKNIFEFDDAADAVVVFIGIAVGCSIRWWVRGDPFPAGELSGIVNGSMGDEWELVASAQNRIELEFNPNLIELK